MSSLSARLISCAGVAALAAACATTAPPVDPFAGLPAPLAPMSNPEETVAAYLGCLREADVTVISAHRGGVEPGFPENALESMANTAAQGGFIMEIDIRATADGVFVLLHDEALERTSTGEGLIAETAVADLDGLTLMDNDGAATEFAIPTLDQALAWGRDRAILQLDVKRGAPIDQVAQAVVDADAVHYAAVIAYSVEDALTAYAVDPRLTISVGLDSLEDLDALNAAGLSNDNIMVWTGVGDVRPDYWAALAERNVSTAFGALWTIDVEVQESGEASRYAELAEQGVDVLATDYHLLAYEALETRQDTAAAIAACSAGRP